MYVLLIKTSDDVIEIETWFHEKNSTYNNSNITQWVKKKIFRNLLEMVIHREMQKKKNFTGQKCIPKQYLENFHVSYIIFAGLFEYFGQPLQILFYDFLCACITYPNLTVVT